MQKDQIILTQGNIDNSHFNLRKVRSLFPPDVFGGSNSEHLGKKVSIDWGGTETAETDIDAEKMIFRRRKWVKQFFATNRLTGGDRIEIEKLGDYAYRISPVPYKADSKE
jgi:hypothetical protein